MKKITLIALLSLGLGCLSAQAGDDIIRTRPDTPAGVESNFRNSLWYNSGNRAGLAFNPLLIFNDLDLTYGLASGEFRPQTMGRTEHDISLNTRGAAMVGKFMLLGNFSFINRFEKGTCYNTVLYETADDMPYFIMDPNLSDWVKQEYDLGASLISPIVAERISFGLQLHYLTKVGAKQKDPRSENYKYRITVTPSIAINLGKTHLLGFHGTFTNGFERAVPTLNNYMVSQKIVYNKGLGEGMNGKVGDNDGLKTIFYKSMEYGGGLQYAWGKDTGFLIDLEYLGRKVDGFEHPRLPKRLGSTRSNDINGDIQVTFGKAKSNKFTFKSLYSSTKGLEHIQKLNDEAFNQRWETISTNNMMNMQRINARLMYDHLFGADPAYGFNWSVGAFAEFDHKSDVYTLPNSTYSATNLILGINGGKQFKFRTSTLLIALDLGYRLNLGGSYNYGGKKKESIQVAYYTAENAYLNTDFLKTGGRIAWTYNARKVNWFIDLKADWSKPLEIKDDRLLCEASVGIVF